METYIIYLVGTLVSCLINSIILFQFIEERNQRIFKSRLLYLFLKSAICLIIVYINLMGNPVVNIFSWILLFSSINVVFYASHSRKLIYRILEIPVLILILTVCETVGVFILDFIVWRMKLYTIQTTMRDSMEITFSKLVVLIFYYLLIAKLWRTDFPGRSIKIQFLVEVVIILFSVANLAVIIMVISKIINQTERILLLINMVFLLFADLYFLYFARVADGYNQLKLKLKLLEQQSVLQYEYYEEQEEKYNESVKILHDINKHLKMIEKMYEAKEGEIAITYTQEISKMLLQLTLEEYTNNPILNVLLNDKKKIAKLHNIEFNLEVGIADLSFMQPIEVTTIFGNLLDNAIEACDKVREDKFIKMKLEKYNDFIAINITNSTVPIQKWHLGKPISDKGKNHGIGLLNVENIIEKYNGSMLLQEQNEQFICKIIFNK